MSHNPWSMANPDRLTGLDASFLALEDDGAHMHVGSFLVFEGRRPATTTSSRRSSRACTSSRATARSSRSRRWRRRGRCGSTIRTSTSATTSATPRCPRRRATSSCASWPAACSPSSSTARKPLWEIWLVDRVDERPASRSSARRTTALVDGISGVDIMTVLFDLEPDPPEREPRPPWYPRPEPSGATLFGRRAGRARERPRSTSPGRRVGARRHPRQAGSARGEDASPGSASMAAAGVGGAPASPLNTRSGPHRRFAWVDGRPRPLQGDQGRARRDRQRRRARRRRRRAARRTCCAAGRDPSGVELKAMVPVSIRADDGARRARQPRRGDVRAAAGRRSPTRSSASRSSTRRWTA